MSNAYYEKIARINLTTGEIKVEPLDLKIAQKFIGGRGLGTKILYDEGVATADPLSADNKLVYITGPMTGSNSPSSGRYMVVTKSPLTGMIACANSGGIWGAKLKFAGWDALIVEGVAPEWSYINITDDKIEILDAREYLGMLSEEMDDRLKAKHGDACSVLNIGPAGEKQVLLASVMNDKDRAAGRSGTGAVMGSKKALIEWTKRMGDPKTELDWLMSSGPARLCEHYGHPEFSMSVKKQEIPAYDARAIQGIGINYATANCGAAHVRGYMIAPEVLGIPAQLDRTVTDEKAGWAKTFQDLTAVIDSMGNCLFTSFALGAPEYASLLNAATGTNYTPEELLEVGDRIFNIERMFNKAAGMKPEDDRLPKRLLTEPISNGPSKGMVNKIDITLPQYYAARGWVNAFPTDETLKKLGLDECVGK